MSSNIRKCFDLKKVDCYRFAGFHSLERYLKEMLCVDIVFDDTSHLIDNISCVMVNQNGENQLKVFPWNQLLVQTQERCDLVKVLGAMYGACWQDLCYMDIDIPLDNTDSVDWNVFLHECVSFLTQMESQKFYPVIMTIGNRVEPYLKIICLK